MRWYLNDVSIQGQYENKHTEFLGILSDLISVGNQNKNFMDNLHVISSIRNAKVDQNLIVSDLLYNNNYPEFRNIKVFVIGLINHSKPFESEGEREIYENSGDKIEFENDDVKLTAIGLAIYNLISKNDSTLFSFPDGVLNFERNPLSVDYRNDSGSHEVFNIRNFWDVDELEKHIKYLKPRNSWEDLIKILREEFTKIEFSDDIFKIKKQCNYSESTHNKIYELLGFINKYMCHRENGVEDEIAREIRQNIFLGSVDKFSDEGTGNIQEFRNKMTFKSINGGEILATWHGKFWADDKRYSIHFDWPPDRNTKKIEILYIGRKISAKN